MLFFLIAFVTTFPGFVDSLIGLPSGSMVKNLPAMQKTWVQSLGWEDPLEKEMATLQCSCLGNPRQRSRGAWAEEPVGLQSMRSQKSRP